MRVADLLRHAGGLHPAMPRRARMRTLLDCVAMETRAAATAVDAAAAADGEFEGAPWGWAVCGLLRAAGHPDADTCISKVSPAGLRSSHTIAFNFERLPSGHGSAVVPE